MTKINHKCCGAFEKALNKGTDNEMHGALLHGDKDGVFAGCNLPKLAFCPWCGTAINKAA